MKDLLLFNEGNSWSEDELVKLLTAYNSGTSLDNLVVEFGRSKNALSSKLRKCNKFVVGLYCLRNKAGKVQLFLSQSNN